MKVLVFIPYGRLEQRVVDAVIRQENVEFFDVWFCHDNPFNNTYKGTYANIQLAYEKMRQVVLREGYEAVWIVEADTVPPLDALSKLLAVDAPVVSGLYLLRHGTPSPNIYMAYNGTPIAGSGMTLDEMKSLWGQRIDMSGGCMGCLLVRREVLENFEMIVENFELAPDGPFMDYCWKNGIKQVARLDVVCGHIRPDGKMYLPDKDNGFLLN